MRELVLLLTDVYLPPDTDAPVAHALGTARYRAAETLPSGWRDWLAHQLGRQDLVGWPVAALVAAAHPPAVLGTLPHTAPPFRSDVMLATPLHLVAGMDHVRLPAEGLLRLPAEELDGLATSFDSTLGADRGLTMRAVSGGSLLLSGMPLSDVITEDPARWLGADLREALPRGSQAGAVRALAGELELWLHQHPVNALRALRGDPAISALWLWGAGPRPRIGAVQAGRPRHERDLRLEVLTRDAAALALARLARIEPLAEQWKIVQGRSFDALLNSPPLRGIVVLALSDFGGQGLAGFEQEWLRPARAALQGGRLDALRIMANDCVVSLMRFDEFKLWRPLRHWLRALS